MSVNSDNLLGELKNKMGKVINHMRDEFSSIRTGKASPSLVEGIIVDYYGTQVKLKEIANITCPEARLIVIQPYDVSASSAIEKAISKSNLGINPINDGKILRLPIPELSEERRKVLAKQVAGIAENSRVGIRNIRREGNDFAKKEQKAGNLTEDDLKKLLEDIQKLTDNKIKEIDKILEDKENELLKL